MEISGHTELYAIIADPIGHVRTPQAINALFRERGIDGVMVPFHVVAEDLAAFVGCLRGLHNFKGMIATVPHKTQMPDLCDELVGDAAAIGASNAIHRTRDGRLIGAMFDGTGFVAGLQAEGHQVHGRQVVLLGAGGAGQAIAFALAAAGVAGLHILNRTGERSRSLADRVRARYPSVPVSVDQPHWPSVELLVNATSLGLRAGDPLPVSESALHAGMTVAEIIMVPEETALMQRAVAAGCRVHAGRHMLLNQLGLMAGFMRNGVIDGAI